MRTDDTESRRVAAIRRHRGKPDAIRELKARIRQMVLDGESAKAIALTVSLTSSNTCKWIHAIGFRRMHVTAEERRQIMAKRRADKAKEAAVK